MSDNIVMDKLVFDRSARTIDDFGRLHVSRSHISKEAVNPYFGKEIPNYESLGLNANDIYQVYRPADELEKAASAFQRLPILSKHIKVTIDDHQPDKIIGAIGSNVEFNKPYLDADITIWESAALAGIESEDVMELSCSYGFIPVLEKGSFEGVDYSVKMTEIKGNHLAVVENGRAGSDVVVADNNPFINQKESEMKLSKLGKALMASLSEAMPALASNKPQGVASDSQSKTLDTKAIKAKLLAMDASLDPKKLDTAIGSLFDVDDEPNAKEPAPPIAKVADDETPEDKIKSMLNGKVDESVINAIIKMIAAPADDKADKADEKMSKDDVETAMDSLRKELRESAQASRDVRNVVGDVAMDSAEGVYAFALDHLGVDHKGVQGVAALRALFNVASKQQVKAVVVGDSKTVERFPSLKRFTK